MVYKNVKRTAVTAKEVTFEAASTQTITVRLRPASIHMLKRLSAKYGGVGRAIQVAVEILRERGAKYNNQMKVTLAQHKDVDSRPQELFSFPAVPRTAALLNRLGLRYYDEVKNQTVRACIQLLHDMEIEDEMPDYNLDQ